MARTAPSLPEPRLRPQLLRLAVLPPTAVALCAVAAVLFTVRTTGARTGPALYAVLAGAASVAFAGIVIAAVAAGRAARSVHVRLDALRDATTRREAALHALVDALRHGGGVPPRTSRGGPPDDADEFELLAADLSRAHDGAVAAVVQAAQLSSQAGSEQKLEVFLNLARRLQSLVHREISTLDELENEIEDPDLLKGLFHVDHLATRIRRHAENLAVLGGAVSRRQWSNPVPMTEVLRSAIAEVEQYSRVKLVPPVDGRLRGHAVADVIHLLAELVENATVFSAPHTQVLLRAGLVTSGLAVEVEDRGLGMPVGEQVRMNALLADPDQVNVASLLADGRIGLFVVSQLARRHGITVRLQTNIYGGVQAVLVVPQALLGAEPVAFPESAPGTAPARRPAQALPPAHEPHTPTQAAPRPPESPAPTRLPEPPVPTRVPEPPQPPYATEWPSPARATDLSGGSYAAQPPGTSYASGTPAATHASEPSGTPHATEPPDPAQVTEPSGSAYATAPSGPVHGTEPSEPLGVSSSAPEAPYPAQFPGPSGPAAAPEPSRPSGLSGAAASPGNFAPAPPSGPTGTSGLPADGAAGTDVHPANGAAGTDVHPADGAAGTDVRPPDGARAGAAPAPLPRRGDREGRANPAEALPGIRPGDRAAVAAHEGVVPAPRAAVVRGTMERPLLPRRRAQEHIAPQLRGGPAPRQDSEHTAGHDPGLMAAFQRGIGLAEAAERRRDPDRPEPFPPSAPDTPHAAPAPDPAPRPDGSASAG
ncbi:hypothetical protein GCM10023336_38330 [Streptomyces similanensis]|uniref:histidine kinase n=1 Tax=Streptomyces similanensis TaxID=1274988 RepID=A0ABP9KPF8_9ACTN